MQVGDTATRSLELTQKHVATYAELSGDYNPLHFDEDFAAGTPFGKLVVQGGLTTGLLHALIAMDMPGPGSVFLSQDWKFTAPVFIGDTITALDIYWAVFAALLSPLPEAQCSMPRFLRRQYELGEGGPREAADPILLEHRDMIYRDFLELPLDF